MPGILKCFGTNPTLVRQMIDIFSTLLFADGRLTRQQKEMIATYVSKLNGCPYCLDSHRFFLLVHGAAEEMARKIISSELDDAEIRDAGRHLLFTSER